MLKDLTNRADVSLLVHAFYSKIRADKEINFYFNEMISDWDEHLEKLGVWKPGPDPTCLVDKNYPVVER